jgi:hypothetical protein
MKKIIIILCLLVTIFIVINLSATSQETESVLYLLEKNTWIVQGVIGINISYKYESNHQISYVDGRPGRPFEFYLSNERDSVFNFDRKSGIENGRYIITRMIREEFDERPRPITILEIIEISDNRLLLKSQNNSLIEYKAE